MAKTPSAPKSVPKDIAHEIATTRDGRDITQPFIAELLEARDPLLFQSVDWGVYDTIFRDDQVKATWQQRVGAVVSREWDVIPGGDAPIDIECGDRFKENLERIGIDRPTEKMLKAIFNGYAVAELMWGHDDGLLQFTAIRVRHARRFRFDKDGRLRLLTRAAMRGEMLPDRKFWVLTAGGDDDDEVYGRGLAYWLYWPTLFKRNGVKFWQTFLDKFGTPTAKGTYRPGTPKAEIDKLLAALSAIATDSGFVVPEGMAVELIEAARSGTADFEKLCRYMDGAIAKVMLSQTMTTDDGSSQSQANVHAGVKLEVVKADADLLCESFNNGPAAWWRDVNYPTAALPRLVRIVEEEADLKQLADTDAVLKGIGWERSGESFKDTYGDGYEKREPVDPPPAIAGQPPTKSGTVPDLGVDPKLDGGEQQPLPPSPAKAPLSKVEGSRDVQDTRSFAAGDLKTLYVSRKVENAGDILAWARRNGIANLYPPEKLHVTVAFSRRPLDWMKIEPEWNQHDDGRYIVQPGGPRRLDEIAPGGPAVLLFNAESLRWRHERILKAGASWDWPDYHPHITLSGDPLAPLAEIEAYQGPIMLGPEIFAELDEDWAAWDNIKRFAEAQLQTDDIDAAVEQLLDEGWREAIDPMLDPLMNALTAAASLDDARRIVAQRITTMSTEELAEMLARATFAARFLEEAKGDGEGRDG